MHKYGIITVLPFSKYASPLFAQRKPIGKLRLLVDLWQINSLIADDYTNNNHAVSTLSDAEQHLAGKSLFCKLNCSQAYHCLQLADQRSVETLASNFASWTFANKRLAQGVSRSVSAFSSYMREYLDPVVKADQCAQYVEDIGIAANKATDLTRNIRAVIECIRQAGLKLTIEKCHFGVRQIQFLGRTISPVEISRKLGKFKISLINLDSPNQKRHYSVIWVLWTRKYFPRMAEKLNPFYNLLKTEVPIKITSELKETFDSVNKALSDACEIAVKQPIPGKQLVLMTDASFGSAGYALMIEDSPDLKIQSKRKTYGPCHLAQKFSPPHSSRCPNTQKSFWQSIWHFSSLHTFCGKQKSQQLSWQTTRRSPAFSKQRQSHQHSGLHVIMCCYLTSKSHRLLDQLTLQLTFSQDLNSKSRRRYVSKSGKISKQHPLIWQPLPLTSLTKINFSSRTQTTVMSQKKRPLNEKNNRERMRSNGQRMMNHPSWKQVWKKSQRSTEILRRIPWMELKQMQEYE